MFGNIVRSISYNLTYFSLQLHNTAISLPVFRMSGLTIDMTARKHNLIIIWFTCDFFT